MGPQLLLESSLFTRIGKNGVLTWSNLLTVQVLHIFLFYIAISFVNATPRDRLLKISSKLPIEAVNW